MPAPDTILLVTAAVLLVAASAAIGGLRVHMLLAKFAPPLAVLIPRGLCILVGLAAGLAAVMAW